VGLRYQDVIDQQAVGLDRPWSDLLNPSVAGFLGAEVDSIRRAVREVQETVLFELDGAEGAQARLTHGLAEHAETRRPVYLFDADYYREAQHGGSEVLGLLDYFRGEAGNLFRWAISDTLQEALGRRELHPAS
jgi:uncharacterized protein (TIGR04255 family)